MKKIILVLLATYSLIANTLPKRIETTIKSIQGNTIELAYNMPKGVSGIVLHNYGNALYAITHSVITTGGNRAKISPYIAIKHKNIPTVKTEIKSDDRVILGNFYNNVMVIAPNQQIYSNITKRFHRNWIHPDIYAVQFMKEELSQISLESLNRFAIKNQIGLTLLVSKNKILILDPISKKIIGEEPFKTTNQKAMKPFYSRFPQMDISNFGFSDIKLKEYYKSIREIK